MTFKDVCTVHTAHAVCSNLFYGELHGLVIGGRCNNFNRKTSGAFNVLSYCEQLTSTLLVCTYKIGAKINVIFNCFILMSDIVSSLF